MYLSLSLRAWDCVASARRGLPLGRKIYLLCRAASSAFRAAPHTTKKLRGARHNGTGLPVFEYKYNVQILYGKTVFEAPVNLNMVKVPYCKRCIDGHFYSENYINAKTTLRPLRGPYKCVLDFSISPV